MHLTPAQTFLGQRDQVVSYWKIGKPVTAGHWYHIFRAKPKSLGSDHPWDYVIKLVNPDLPPAKLQFALDRLGREAIATEQIMHSNVIRLLDAELDRAPFFLVQPWMTGKSLDRFHAGDCHTTVNRLIWVARQIAEALYASHERGRVHLGLDPSHVLLGPTGRTTRIGWSQSHPVGQEAWLPHDRLQLAKYTAPECFEKGYYAKFASDVYALGALMYKMFSRVAPYEGQSIEEIATASQKSLPIDLMIQQPVCPAPIYRLVRRMLLKNPAKRPPMRQVLEKLITAEIEHLCDPTLVQL